MSWLSQTAYFFLKPLAWVIKFNTKSVSRRLREAWGMLFLLKNLWDHFIDMPCKNSCSNSTQTARVDCNSAWNGFTGGWPYCGTSLSCFNRFIIAWSGSSPLCLPYYTIHRSICTLEDVDSSIHLFHPETITQFSAPHIILGEKKQTLNKCQYINTCSCVLAMS